MNSMRKWKRRERGERKEKCIVQLHTLCTEIIYIVRILVVIIIVIVIASDTAILVDFRSRVSIVEASVLKQHKKHKFCLRYIISVMPSIVLLKLIVE